VERRLAYILAARENLPLDDFLKMR